VATLIAVLLMLAMASGAGAASNMPVFFNAEFSPAKLSRSKPTPITFDFTFFTKVREGQRPPALKEFLLEGDKYASVDVRGIPTCGGIRSDVRRSFEEVRKMCKPALIGSGHVEVAVKFPDYPSFALEGDVLAINGGVEGGVTTMYLHAYLPAPVTSWIVATVETKRIRKGRYGMEAVTSIPKIAGGAGSVTRFNLTLKRGILLATCPDGRLEARGTSIFSDGTRSPSRVIRTCVPRD
jgi:hypothetical protein